MRILFAALMGLFVAASASAQVQVNDIAFGLSNSNGLNSLELVRGFPGGAAAPDPWSSPFIQSMQFDNSGGWHHHQGNLLGLNFGTSGTGGSLSNHATDGSPSVQNLGNLTGGVTGLALSRLGGLSVSPDNSKIAATGFDSRKVLVWDYDAGLSVGQGVGASVSGGRETPGVPLAAGFTQGTTWLDNQTVLAFQADGNILSVNAGSMAVNTVATFAVPGGASRFTSMEYNPTISPFVYGMYSQFAGGVTTNLLYVFDPATWLQVPGSPFDFSQSMQTAREIAFDTRGNLFVGQFSSAIDFIPNAANPAVIVANGSVDYYASPTFSSFNGLDVALPEPGTLMLLTAGLLGLRRRRKM